MSEEIIKVHFTFSPKAKVTACGLKKTDRMEIGTLIPFDAVVLFCGDKVPQPGEVSFMICQECIVERDRTRIK